MWVRARRRWRLKLEFNWDLVPAYNVIAKLEGREEPDQWILRGNHHDAWVHGARDPVSGVAAMLGRGPGGGQPDRRRLGVLAAASSTPAWDAEEPGSDRLHRVGGGIRGRV